MIIINADDFGMSNAVSSAIALAAQNKLINSLSFAVNNIESRSHVDKNLLLLSDLVIGLHINLSEGPMLSRSKKFLPAQDIIFREKSLSRESIEEEIEAQISYFISLVGKQPAHLDSHQHIAFLSPTIFSALLCVSLRTNIPIRSPKPFLDQARLQNFLLSLTKRFGLILAIDPKDHVEKLNAALQKYTLLSRSDDCIIDFDFSVSYWQKNIAKLKSLAHTTEIICHPRFVTNSDSLSDSLLVM
jgi:predicted glycoside hydrolase/deacetylase ChbG (UPF0249 family)